MSEGMSETQPKQADTELEALLIEGLTTGENHSALRGFLDRTQAGSR